MHKLTMNSVLYSNAGSQVLIAVFTCSGPLGTAFFAVLRCYHAAAADRSAANSAAIDPPDKCCPVASSSRQARNLETEKRAHPRRTYRTCSRERDHPSAAREGPRRGGHCVRNRMHA